MNLRGDGLLKIEKKFSQKKKWENNMKNWFVIPAVSKPAYLIQELFHLGRPFLNSKLMLLRFTTDIYRCIVHR
jgi:hypothetical protein